MRKIVVGTAILAVGLLISCWGSDIPEKVTLDNVEQYDFVDIRATGQDLDVVNLHVESSRHGFDLEIPAGTLLVNGSGGRQNMMVAKGAVVSFKDPSQPLIQDIQLEVYCVNLSLDVPTLDDTFTVGDYEPQDPLVAFVRCLEGHAEEDKDIRQLAVWVKSDNPTWKEYVELDRIEDLFEEVFRELFIDMRGRPPTSEELEEMLRPIREVSDEEMIEMSKEASLPDLRKAHRLFESCGESTSDRNLFQDLGL